jgi:DNA polymerase-3 subunit delta
MTREEALEQARSKELRPVYLVAGEETFLVQELAGELKRATLAASPAGLNDDLLDAAEVHVDQALAAARTLPMMAKKRWVCVRNIDKWEASSAGGEDEEPSRARPSKGAKASESAWDKLLAYAEQPNPSTTLVLLASKVDKRRRLVTNAVKGGWFVACDPLGRAELPRWIARRAKARSYPLAPGIEELIAELAGPELAAVSDALERVGLYRGVGNTVTEDDVAECLVRVRPTTVWELVAAVGRRDAGAALRHLADVYDPQDRGLRLVGVLAWAARQLLRFESALRQGARPEEAAKAAGAPPFKARQLAEEVKRMPQKDIERWLEMLAVTDLKLKGGSRLPPRAVLETAILKLCTPDG